MRPNMTERTPDFAQAQRFLDALEPNGRFTFQTFADNKSVPESVKAPCVRISHGTLAEHAAALIALQNKGAGVFVTVNQTNLRGRAASDIVGVRCLFVDLDGAPIDPVLQFDLKPHVVVESSGGRWHAYWRVKDFPRERFSDTQKALIGRLNGDDTVHDLPRVLRVPGFWHLKAEPFM
jgi:putative DNA primase/helicase